MIRQQTLIGMGFETWPKWMSFKLIDILSIYDQTGNEAQLIWRLIYARLG